MRKLNFNYLAVLAFALITAGCSDDDNSIPEEEEGGMATDKYAIAATPEASEGMADYLLTSESITEGEISLSGNGIEQDGSYRYYITNNNKFFSLLYGIGSPGAVTTYQLDGTGELDQLSDFQAETVHTFTSVDDDVLMTQVSRSSDDPYAYWFILDTETSQFTANGEINTADLAPEGEQAYFSCMTQVGNKVFAPFFSVKACCSDTFGTDYPDQT